MEYLKSITIAHGWIGCDLLFHRDLDPTYPIFFRIISSPIALGPIAQIVYAAYEASTVSTILENDNEILSVICLFFQVSLLIWLLNDGMYGCPSYVKPDITWTWSSSEIGHTSRLAVSLSICSQIDGLVQERRNSSNIKSPLHLF